MLVSPVTYGLLGQGIATGGFVQGSSIPLIAYPDPTKCAVIPNDAVISDIDPTKMAIAG